MNLKSHKGAIELDGVAVHVTRENDSVKRIELTGTLDGEPAFYVLALGSYGIGIDVLVQAPPKMVKRYRLAGEIAGAMISHDYETRMIADDAQDAFGSAGNKLEITEVEIPDPEAA
jgi:hypothetical protein